MKNHNYINKKKKISKNLFSKENTILNLERNLRVLQSKLERQKNVVLSENIPDNLASYLKRRVLRIDSNIENFSRDKAQKFIEEILPSDESDRINSRFFKDLLEYNLIRDDGRLTIKGYSLIKNMLKGNI